MFSSSPPRPPADLPSTQAPSHRPIPFTQSHPHQTFRLLELPPELLALLTSADPPTLQLKSAARTPVHGTPGSQAASYAHLVSDTQTWQLRQVSTSNSIYVCDTVTPQGLADDGALNAIGQCGSVLECLPTAYDVDGMLKRILPAWHSDTGPEARPVPLTIAALQEEIPAPEGAIREACRRLCVVEIEGQAYVPDDEALLAAWEAGVGGLDREDCSGVGGELRFVWEAVYKSLPEEDVGEGLKREEATAWIGELLLRCVAKHGGIGIEEFLGRWRNCVPEGWGGFVRLEGVREGVYQLLEDGREIRWRTGEVVNGLEGGTKSSGATTEGKKRKWHERFKEQRTQTKR